MRDFLDIIELRPPIPAIRNSTAIKVLKLIMVVQSKNFQELDPIYPQIRHRRDDMRNKVTF